MMRIQAIILLLSLIATAVALRGESPYEEWDPLRESGRKLGKGSGKEIHKDEAKMKEEKMMKEEKYEKKSMDKLKKAKKVKKAMKKEKKTKKDKKGKKEAKKEKCDKSMKSSKKSSKSSKSDKKCKKAKKSKKSATSRVEATSWMNPADVGNEDESDIQGGHHHSHCHYDHYHPYYPYPAPAPLPYCYHSSHSAEQCSSIESGELPGEDDNVKGEINMEISSDDDPDQIKRSLEGILRSETPSKFVGCDSQRRLADEANEVDEAGSDELYEQTDLSVTGVEFPSLEVSRKDCENTNDGSDMNCNLVEAEALVYFTGEDKVSQEQKEEMFDLLVEIIQVQASTGSFAKAGEVKSVELTGVSSDSGDGGGSSAGIAGITVGAVAVVGLIAAMFYDARRKTTTVSKDTTSQAHAVVLDEEATEMAGSVESDEEATEGQADADIGQDQEETGETLDEVEVTVSQSYEMMGMGQ